MNKSEKYKFWMELMSEFNKSGMTIIAFCQEWNIAKHNFIYWKRKFSKERKVAKFVEVSLCDSPPIPEVPIDDPVIRICVGEMTIEVDQGFNKQTLIRVLDCFQC